LGLIREHFVPSLLEPRERVAMTGDLCSERWRYSIRNREQDARQNLRTKTFHQEDFGPGSLKKSPEFHWARDCTCVTRCEGTARSTVPSE